MKGAVVKEGRAFERRVAASPDTVKRMIGMGLQVVVESGAGEGAWFSNAAFAEAGASIATDEATALGDADIVLKVQRPLIGGETGIDELALLKRGAVLIGLLQPAQNPADAEAYAGAGVAAFAMELVPRITRAQAMDVLSSQANLAGYKAVVDAAAEFGRAFPMMMTAAGTIKAARLLVMGAGAAGSVIVDLAAEAGGNVEGSRPEEVVLTPNGVKIIAPTNMPSRIAADASQLYARNLLSFLSLLVDKDRGLKIDTNDEIIKATLLTENGAVVNPSLAPSETLAAAVSNGG